MIGRATGTVLGAGAGLVRASLPGVAAGTGVTITSGTARVRGVVRAVSTGAATIVTAASTDGIVAGDGVSADPGALRFPLGMQLLGRAVDAAGEPLDGKPLATAMRARLALAAPRADERVAVAHPFWTGVKCIDGLLTFGRGARIGIFGTPGAGKSTLLRMLAGSADADAVVAGLIGERGREAAEWIARCNERTTIVSATSDRSAGERIAAAHAAVAQARVLRSRGLHVLLILDSLARYAGALRDVAVACGEPVGRAGFPAGVFSDMARLLEVAGETQDGSVTLVATVLSEGADENDPLSEAARSLLDGHIVLSAALAHAGRFPAIDVLSSASRTMANVTCATHLAGARAVRSALATLAHTADARSLGLPLADPAALAAQALEPALEAFLRQGEISIKPGPVLDELRSLADILEERSWTSQPT